MSFSQETLGKWQSIASIISSIAIPVVLAVFGYILQDKVSTEGLKKDYVQIAISILKENSSGQDVELRKWAVTVLDDNSPIPFTKQVKANLEKGYTVMIPINKFVFPPEPESCMNTPKKLFGLDKGIVDGDVVMQNLVENAKNFESNRIDLQCLQTWIRDVKKAIGEYDEKGVIGEKGYKDQAAAQQPR